MKPIPDKLRGVLVSLCRQAVHLLRGEAVSIWLRDGDRLYLAEDAGSEIEKPMREAVFYQLGEGITGWVAANAKTVRLTGDGLRSHASWRGKWDVAMWPDRSAYPTVRGFLGVPICDEGNVLGIIRASSAETQFSEVDQRMLETIAELIATALKAEPDFVDIDPGPYLFVLMPFAEAFADIYTLGIKSVASELGFRCERVDEIEFNDVILSQIYDGIQRADLVIADMTGRNPNVFYEVGYAHALSKQVVLLTQKSKDIPFDLAGHNHIIYKGSITTVRERLEKRLAAPRLALPPLLPTPATSVNAPVRWP